MAKFDDAGEVSEVIIRNKINDEKVWMSVRALPRWKREKRRLLNAAQKVRILSSKSKNECATEIEDPEDDSTDTYPPLGMWYFIWKLCIYNVSFVNFNAYCFYL